MRAAGSRAWRSGAPARTAAAFWTARRSSELLPGIAHMPPQGTAQARVMELDTDRDGAMSFTELHGYFIRAGGDDDTAEAPYAEVVR
mmetsp:Transcript_105098/g.297364  ORF Transcript_105098/g.297364 Transcript_105098/m.297364 type:complete len:87 (+) Transcript_105098:179-439(+)